jgi:dTDP-4-amino-4,6-dideoxygalactose transaminase
MKRQIKFLDLSKQIKDIKNEIMSSIYKNIQNTDFVGGKSLKIFESSFKKYLKVKYALGVANGTDALEIAIQTLGIKKGSEILVPANTWISTAEAVINSGCKVKFVDVDFTHNLCVNDLRKKISKKTEAIIVVHLFGNPANVLNIQKICRKNGIYLIEDCAQAHGARIGNKKVGSFGHISTFSFFPSKNLGCFGDGGMIVTNQKRFFLLAKKLANHGGLNKNSHEIIGRNSRLDSIQAGILNIKLKKLNSWIKKRNIIANLYYKLLKNVGDLKFIKKHNLILHSYHLFVIKTKNRDRLSKFLKENHIETSIHYPSALPNVNVFRKKHLLYCKKMNAIKFNNEILSLPMGEHLNTNDINFICSKIKDFYQ